MNAAAPRHGLAGRLASLNGDRGYGWALLAAIFALGALELGGEPVRQALCYDREALGRGEWWRLLSAHFVHLDARHMLLNVGGLILMWALFARDYPPLRWLTIYLGAGLAVSAGLWTWNPEVPWYVGASGTLHGVMAAGTLARLRRRDRDGWILLAFLIAKLSYEQLVGPMPFAGADDTIVDAHLYGAVGGFACAALLRSRRDA